MKVLQQINVDSGFVNSEKVSTLKLECITKVISLNLNRC